MAKLSKQNLLNAMGVVVVGLFIAIGVLWLFIHEPAPKKYVAPEPTPRQPTQEELHTVKVQEIQALIDDLDFSSVFEDMDLRSWGFKKKW